MEQQDSWLLFDDKNVTKVGSWEGVKNRCYRGKLQPVMILYERIEEEAPPPPSLSMCGIASSIRPTTTATEDTYVLLHIGHTDSIIDQILVKNNKYNKQTRKSHPS